MKNQILVLLVMFCAGSLNAQCICENRSTFNGDYSPNYGQSNYLTNSDQQVWNNRQMNPDETYNSYQNFQSVRDVRQQPLDPNKVRNWIGVTNDIISLFGNGYNVVGGIKNGINNGYAPIPITRW